MFSYPLILTKSSTEKLELLSLSNMAFEARIISCIFTLNSESVLSENIVALLSSTFTINPNFPTFDPAIT